MHLASWCATGQSGRGCRVNHCQSGCTRMARAHGNDGRTLSDSRLRSRAFRSLPDVAVALVRELWPRVEAEYRAAEGPFVCANQERDGAQTRLPDPTLKARARCACQRNSKGSSTSSGSRPRTRRRPSLILMQGQGCGSGDCRHWAIGNDECRYILLYIFCSQLESRDGREIATATRQWDKVQIPCRSGKETPHHWIVAPKRLQARFCSTGCVARRRLAYTDYGLRLLGLVSVPTR